MIDINLSNKIALTKKKQKNKKKRVRVALVMVRVGSAISAGILSAMVDRVSLAQVLLFLGARVNIF